MSKHSIHHALDRIEHWSELFSIEDDDLRILVDAQYKEHEYMGDRSSKLPEDEQYWELSIHLGAKGFLESTEADLDGEIRFEYDEMDHDTFLDIVYPHTVERIEEEYGDTVDALLYFDPENIDYSEE